MLNYNIPAAVIYLHNHSTLDLLPSAVEKAWQKLAPLFMEDQSQTSAEVAHFKQRSNYLPFGSWLLKTGRALAAAASRQEQGQ